MSREAVAADFGMAETGTARKAAMDPGFAVFNGHVNNADRRARDLMRRWFKSSLAEVEAIEEKNNGIMAIFHNDPTPAVLAYVALVTAFVNEDRV